MADLLKRSDIGALIYERLKSAYLKKIPYGNEFSVIVDDDPIMKKHGIREDHIAFRTFFCDTGEIPRGIESVERIFRACGWSRGVDAETGEDYRYDFPNMNVRAIHVEFPEDRPDLPKIFISELVVDDLAEKADQSAIIGDLKTTKDPLTEEDRGWLKRLEADERMPASYAKGFADRCYQALDRPWLPPHRSTILETDKRSQYTAWTLLNGGMNHIAYLTKDLEATAQKHSDHGRELLPNIMGSKEVGLLQTSVRSPYFMFDVTEDAEKVHDSDGKLEFQVREQDGTLGTIRWTGPFAELIERPLNPDGTRRENFLASNAAHIFAATKNKEKHS